jgi:hypothetical protein
LDNDVLRRFEKIVADYYQRIEQNHLNEVKLELKFEEDQNDKEDENADVSVIIKYKTGNVCLTAKKFGLTYISVDVEFLDKTDKIKLSERESQIENNDLPF